MSWTAIVGFLLVVLFIAGIVCTVLYCYALFKYIRDYGFGDECDDDWL